MAAQVLAERQIEEAAAVGDRPGLPDVATIYRDHAPFVWRILRRLGVSAAEVDDAAHRVFMVVHRRHADLAGEPYVRSWLFGIARRVSYELQREDRRRQRDAAVAAPRTISDDPERVAVATERALVARRLLDRLDESLRLPFVLAELEEMSAPEIAATLDLNVNTVYSRVRRAREALAKLVARERLRGEQQR